jgi:integrase
MPVTEIVEQDLRDYCFRKDLAPATQASYLTHYKVFFRWLHEKQIVKVNITKDIKASKPPQNISEKTITKEQLEEIFKAFDKFTKENVAAGFITKPHQKRDWFKPMISMFYYCGLRAKEGVNLTWGDVDFKEGFIRVINRKGANTKSGLDRSIPIRKKFKPILQKWHKHLGKPKDGYMFPSATGMNRFQKMNSGAVSRSFKKFVRKAGLQESITLHGLRHTCATELLRIKMPINEVSSFLGHSSVEVTQIYEHLDETDLKETLDALE